MKYMANSQQPRASIPNLQAEANQVTRDVIGRINGIVTQQSDGQIPSINSSTMKNRPLPPIRTSSKTKTSQITNVMSMGMLTNRSSGRSRSDLSSNIDTRTPRTSDSAIDIDATPVDRRGPNELFENENTQPVSPKDTKRSDSIDIAETALVKGKLKDRNSPAQA
jgi:hypothetical protein